MKKLGFMVILTFFVLVSCDNAVEIQGVSWGMTLEEVISIEEEKGNTLYENNTVHELEYILDFEDVIVNDVNIDVRYIFADWIDTLRYLPPVIYDDDLFEYYQLVRNNEGEKLSQLDDQILAVYEEYNDLPAIYTLSDHVLIFIIYNFNNITDEEREELFNSIVDEYGSPEDGSTNYDADIGRYYWYKEEIIIHFSPDYIHYSGTYYSLEDWIESGKYYDTVRIP